ncbi:hypothetical protein FB45DRAFT_272138 [Roridomyces roridus]|uniref:Uncharacterized protein n=1 Tax=Roridomyces roridus TaxID=1738132 RepID=A0AAD7FD34_9AGAR|nr:hypothetical protein FB45DRAFT_272138 [Roridomyces roridus]
MYLSPLYHRDLKGINYPFEGLTSLTIDGSDMSPGLCIELLGRAPNLVDLDILEVRFLPAESTPRHLTIPALRRLHFGRPGEWFWSESSILRLLTLPALQSLVIDIADSGLLDFLTRSAPPLRHLNVRLKADGVLSEGIVACLQLVPGLTDLEILLPHSANSSFDLWTQNSALLPGLQTLVVKEYYDHGMERYHRVLDFLAQRRGSLKSLRLILWDTQSHCKEVWDDAPAAALRAFQSEGIYVHVGTKEINFLSM